MTSVKHPHCYVCGTPIYKADGLGKWPDGRTYHALCQVGIHTKVVGKHRTNRELAELFGIRIGSVMKHPGAPWD